ncbi:MAG: cell surface protein SprA [Bacteroidaceae bacterium]|nr:cell surface protein SprA [Bacteroidaceae bacterium]
MGRFLRQISILLAGLLLQIGAPGLLHAQEEVTEYDENLNSYKVGTKIGDQFLETPSLMSPLEFTDWSIRRSMQSYFQNRNRKEFQEAGQEKFDFTDMKFDLGPAEKIFGPGGVQVKTSGSAALKLGANRNVVNNPSLSAQNRKTFGFDFDEQITLNMTAKVGDKVNMNLNYNTEATFDFNSRKIKLRYEGKEDEIIQLLEAGDVSFPTNSSLINGATSLFGLRTDLQFGKLSLQTVISQKNTSSSTVSSKGGEQLTDFEIDASDYDENRHFFLAHYFRDTYDHNMSMLPTVISGINITRIEVWITNKRSSYESPRNIVAFTDLGESAHISNGMWNPQGGPQPYNGANNLYQTINSSYQEIRDIDKVASVLGTVMSGSNDYEKIANARKLASTEYTLNSALGYISLRTTLASDEVLAVAYEYTYAGKTYQVGEFSSDNQDSDQSLILKLLKSNSNSPGSGTWDLMMKNVYSLGTGSLSRNRFKLNIYYASDSTGTSITYLPEPGLKSQTLLKMMNLDRLDDNQSAHSNGQFDYIEGYTVLSQSGRIIFPVVEPFGSHLREVIPDPATAERYVFQELYDSTKTVARRIAEKDKFLLGGQYSGSSNNEIMLGTNQVPRGSVKVTAGGVLLVENTDYMVDYSLGKVTIINQSIIDAGTDVSVSLESNQTFSMQRKTMAGVNWAYDFSKELQAGGTIMHLNEKPLTSKVAMGDEPLVNTMWGLNLNWKHQSQGITNIIDMIPFVNATVPSQIKFQAEFAQLISEVSGRVQGNASYIDDFEQAETGIDISSPSRWTLASIPQGLRYSDLTNDIRTGFNRALFNWFTIDPLFTRRNSSLTPAHLKSDLDQLSNHFVREVYERELYPNKESTSSESTTLSVLNLAFYPDERGPYNLNPDLTTDGKLTDPQSSWGGIMRSLTTTDFETANIEYMEFWMLDPFVYDRSVSGGDFYINLGEVSEDILKDGKKFFENGLPTDDDPSRYTETVWGRVPNTTSLVYAFDNSDAANRARQDVGLNGLSSDEERNFPTYADYLAQIRGRVSDDAYQKIYQDPSGDTYHYYRGSDYDEQKMSILDRYRSYNGTEGNSPNSGDTNEAFNSSSRTTPDVEDANTDYTLDEYEKYFQYRISLRPSDMVVGRNFIVAKRQYKAKLRNGNTETVDWYCFRVPITGYEKVVGSIRDFSSIRFIRLYMTGFDSETHVRLGTFELMTSQWRIYEQAIASASNKTPRISGTISAASVNIEENGDREPVNYVVPPGVTRILDPSQTQLVQDNEQAMSIKVEKLDAGESRAIYKKSALDLRKYQRIQMFTHAESLIDDATGIANGEMSVFVRLGSDYTSNYYEYEIPLSVTPAGFYNKDNESSRREVWPADNMLDISFDILTEVKNQRNKLRNSGNSEVTPNVIYSQYDPNNPANRVSVIGNPSVGNVKAIMIGVRNNSLGVRSAEVWVNELRLVGYESHGGEAARGSLNLQLSDIATVDLNGQYSTAGFGGLEQGVSQRRMDDYYRYSATTSFNMGRFIPQQAHVSLPVYYSTTKERVSPQYSPYDTDLELKEVIDSSLDRQSRDSIRSITQETSSQRNFSITGARIDISSENPMPYDPANFSFSFAHSIEENSGSTIEYETDLAWKAGMSYSYSTPFDGWRPFGFIKYQSNWLNILKDVTINFLPQNLTFNTDLTRNYHELQERDLEGSFGGDGIPATFSQQFYWNRDLSLRWDLFKDLRMNLTTRTQAQVDEPYTLVNKDLYPDEYEFWKDSIKASLRSMGRPLDYQQTFTASYQLPIQKLPTFNWTQFDVSLNSQYGWDRGTVYEDGSSYGDIISNQRTVSFNGKLDFQKLYGKSEYLRKVNEKYQPKNQRLITQEREAKKRQKPNPYQKEIKLVPDSTFTITHNQNTLKPVVTAILKDGTAYKLKYKRPDANTIEIKGKDSVTVKLTVVIDPEEVNKTDRVHLSDVVDFSARTLMMARNLSFTYRNTYAMNLPGFTAGISSFGQGSSTNTLAPGLDFAFGLTDDSYLDRAHSNGWLMNSDSVAFNAASMAGQDLQIKMSLEPVTEFRIDLNASWTRNASNTIQYMYAGMPTSRSGSLTFTTITIGSAFEARNNRNGYASAAFDRFIGNLDRIQQRIEEGYSTTRYPAESSLAGQLYDPANGSVSKYSADVMIPAFLAAYSGRDASRSPLTLFPQMLSILPNWTVSYAGLAKLPSMQKYFRSFNINHSYKSVYSMGSYNTFSSYMECMDGHGFIEDVTTGIPVPSSMYDISSVSINENFSPLIGVDMTFNSGITAKLEIRKSHTMNLSMSAVQLVETTSDDLVAGGGYKIVGLTMLGARPGTGRNKVSNDLNLACDKSYRNQSAQCRNIQNLNTQATSGNRAVKVSFQADYTYSKMMTLNFYYDFQNNFPLVSTNSYPTSTHDCGFTIKFQLTR